MSNRAIAHRLGITEMAIRKLVGPSKPVDMMQPAFAEITTAAAEKPPATHAPSATSTGDDADRATPSTDDDVDRAVPSADDRAGNVDPIAAPVDDTEPVPISLDGDASDRTLDRQLAYLGLLDDAAPLFRGGSSVPDTGVPLRSYGGSAHRGFAGERRGRVTRCKALEAYRNTARMYCCPSGQRKDIQLPFLPTSPPLNPGQPGQLGMQAGFGDIGSPSLSY